MKNILNKSNIHFEIFNLELKKFSNKIKNINEENKEVTDKSKIKYVKYSSVSIAF